MLSETPCRYVLCNMHILLLHMRAPKRWRHTVAERLDGCKTYQYTFERQKKIERPSIKFYITKQYKTTRHNNDKTIKH